MKSNKEAYTMGTFAGILGGIGGFCAVMGIITALGVVAPITTQLT
jgi:hypothetical protein